MISYESRYDQGWGQIMNAARANVSRELKLVFDEYDEVPVDQLGSLVDSLVESGYNLLFVPSSVYNQNSALLGAIQRHPQIGFVTTYNAVILSADPPLPNVLDILLDVIPSLYLLGYMAALHNDTLGVVSHAWVPASFHNAVLMGARHANASARVLDATYLPVFDDTDDPELIPQRRRDLVAACMDALTARGAHLFVDLSSPSVNQLALQRAQHSLATVLDAGLTIGRSVLLSAPFDYSLLFDEVVRLFANGSFWDPQLGGGGVRQLVRLSRFLAPVSADVTVEQETQLMAEQARVLGPGQVWCDTADGSTSLLPLLQAVNATDGGRDGRPASDPAGQCVTVAQQEALLGAPLHPGIEVLGAQTLSVQQTVGFPLGVRIVLYTVTGCALVLVLACVLLTVLFRRRAVVHFASVLFCLLIELGALLGLCGALLVIPPYSEAMCNLFVWFCSIGLGIIISALLAKTYRLAVIARASRRLENVRLSVTNTQLAVLLVVLLLLDVLFLCLFSFVDPVDTTKVYTDPWTYYVECDLSTTSIVSLCILFGVKVVLLVLCSVSAFFARRLPIMFSESTIIFLCTYNLLFGIAAGLPLFLLLDNLTAQVIIVNLIMLLCAGGTVLVLMLPKFYVIAMHKYGHRPIELFDMIRRDKEAARAENSSLVNFPTIEQPVTAEASSISTFT